MQTSGWGWVFESLNGSSWLCESERWYFYGPNWCIQYFRNYFFDQNSMVFLSLLHSKHTYVIHSLNFISKFKDNKISVNLLLTKTKEIFKLIVEAIWYFGASWSVIIRKMGFYSLLSLSHFEINSLNISVIKELCKWNTIFVVVFIPIFCSTDEKKTSSTISLSNEYLNIFVGHTKNAKRWLFKILMNISDDYHTTELICYGIWKKNRGYKGQNNHARNTD